MGELLMGDYYPKDGDTVRVVLEGTVTAAGSGVEGRDFILYGDSPRMNHIFPADPQVISVEKIGPPVVTFQPGEIVESLTNGMPRARYLVGSGGYFSWQTLAWFAVGDVFTSEHYRKVELVEAPF